MAKAISTDQVSTHKQTKPSFLTMSLEWRNIWAAKWWVVLALALFYVGGCTINHGPSMNYLGLIYIHNWFARPTTDGQIFVFTPAHNPWWYKFVPWQQQIKRRIGVTADGRVIYQGDNSEWSEDNRDKFEPVPTDHIAGVVIAAWIPQRTWRSFTAKGRLQNWVEFNYSPSQVVWNPCIKGVWMALSDSDIAVFQGYDCIFGPTHYSCFVNDVPSPWERDGTVTFSDGDQVKQWSLNKGVKMFRPVLKARLFPVASCWPAGVKLTISAAGTSFELRRPETVTGLSVDCAGDVRLDCSKDGLRWIVVWEGSVVAPPGQLGSVRIGHASASFWRVHTKGGRLIEFRLW